LRTRALSLLVSTDNNVPLFHELRPGNANLTEKFSEIQKTLCRGHQGTRNDPDMTLVFDLDGDSASDIEKSKLSDPFSFHFVCGIKTKKYPELSNIPRNEHTPLAGVVFGETKAFRTTKEVFGRKVTAVTT
jgi:transposase